jgi:hypothetical protein
MCEQALAHEARVGLSVSFRQMSDDTDMESIIAMKGLDAVLRTHHNAL